MISRILVGFAKGGGGGRLKTMVCVNILSRFMMNNTSKLGRVITWTIYLEGTRIAQGKNRYLTDGFDTWCFAWKRDPCKFGSCQNFNPELQSGTRMRNKKRTIIWYKKYLLVLEGNKIIALVILRFSEMLWSVILPRNQWEGRMNHKLDFLTKTVWNFLHKASPLGCFM